MLKWFYQYLLPSLVVVVLSQSLVSARSAVEPAFHLPALNKNAKGTIIEDIPQNVSRAFSGTPEAEDTDWFNLGPIIDGVEGASVNLAYSIQYQIDEEEDEVVVAVIDSGIDIHHEDLQGKIWVNRDEIPDNGIDDDGNGYVDDLHGWNFIGGRDGEAVTFDTLEVTREYARYSKRIENGETLTPQELVYFERVKTDFEESRDYAQGWVDFAMAHLESSERNKLLLNEKLGIDDFSAEALNAIVSADAEVIAARDSLLDTLSIFRSYERIHLYINYFSDNLNYYYNPEFDTRATIVKDDPNDPYEHNYGNNDVMAVNSSHGTHVAGIIAADRSNELGVKGVARHVKIMVLRVVPNGDERDKDVANAVRYAVNNGAKVINMSFGKGYSPRKQVVDKAFRYAARHGVLIVHAAGNGSKDLDVADNFPTPKLLNHPHKKIKAWIEVGASSVSNDVSLTASFSNFGKNSVDLFAPGVRILSTTRNNNYSSFSGTSMASPVVAGVAALLFAQDEDLNARSVKRLLRKTVRKYPGLYVNSPENGESVLFSDLSKTGGVVDVYRALRRLNRHYD